MTAPNGLGPLFLIFGSSFLYLGLLGHALTQQQLSWPEPLVQGIYTVWVTSHGPLNRPVLRPDWGGISDFLITWTAVLATLVLLFALGVVLHAYIFQALAAVYFVPLWRPTCTA